MHGPLGQKHKGMNVYDNATVFDVETSRFPDGNPYRESSRCISWAIGQSGEISFGYYKDADFTSRLREALERSTLLVTINGKFDIGWARRLGVVLPAVLRVWDCQLAEYILSGQEHAFASMDQLCERYGIEQKGDDVKGYWDSGVETANIPEDVLERYNRLDIERTQRIFECQLVDSRLTPALKKLILLGGADLLVLQEMEQNGVVYDVEGSIIAGDDSSKELGAINDELATYLIPFSVPSDFNWDSGDDLSLFLFGGIREYQTYEEIPSVYKSGEKKGQTYVRRKFLGTNSISFEGYFKPLAKSEVKKSTPGRRLYSVAEPILRQLKGGGKEGKRLVELLLKRAELGKLVETYYYKLPEMITQMEWEDKLHGNYNQCITRTGRLSSSKPNMQQFPSSVDRLCISRYGENK